MDPTSPWWQATDPTSPRWPVTGPLRCRRTRRCRRLHCPTQGRRCRRDWEMGGGGRGGKEGDGSRGRSRGGRTRELESREMGRHGSGMGGDTTLKMWVGIFMYRSLNRSVRENWFSRAVILKSRTRKWSLIFADVTTCGLSAI